MNSAFCNPRLCLGIVLLLVISFESCMQIARAEGSTDVCALGPCVGQDGRQDCLQKLAICGDELQVLESCPLQFLCPTNHTTCTCGQRCTMQNGAQGVCLEDETTCAQPLIAPNCNSAGGDWADLPECPEALCMNYTCTEDLHCTCGSECCCNSCYPSLVLQCTNGQLAMLATDSCMMAGTPGFCEPPRAQYTCGAIKEAYEESSCCGNPMGIFTLPSSRRMSVQSNPHESNTLTKISVALTRAHMIGGRKNVVKFAASLRNVIRPYLTL